MLLPTFRFTIRWTDQHLQCNVWLSPNICCPRVEYSLELLGQRWKWLCCGWQQTEVSWVV